MDDKEIYNKIKNRRNWFFIFAGSAILVTFIIKLFLTPIKIDLSKFDFSDFLSIFLALFALAISIVFFFKASETSNKFYDNTYNFTKDIAETLGRMEERFGERLKHLDEGYNKVIDHNVFNKKDLAKTEKEIEKEKKELEEKLKEKEFLIDDMIENVKLSESEKNDFKKSLKNKQNEIIQLREQILNTEKLTLHQYSRNLNSETLNLLKLFVYKSPEMIWFPKGRYSKELVENISIAFHKMISNKFSLKHVERIFIDLYHNNLMNNRNSFTTTGINLLASILEGSEKELELE